MLIQSTRPAASPAPATPPSAPTPPRATPPSLPLGGPPPPRDAANIARVLSHAAFDLNHAGRGVVDQETPRRMHLMLTDAAEYVALSIHFADLHPERPELAVAVTNVGTNANDMAARHFTGKFMPPIEIRREMRVQILDWEQVLRSAIAVLGGVPPVA